MSKKPRPKYGDPRKRKPIGDFYRDAQPNGGVDPRTLGGDISGPGGPHDRNAVVIDMTDVVLLQGATVSQVETVRHGAWEGRRTYLQLEGRVNKTTRQVQVGFIAGPDGVAVLITELLAVAYRDSGETLDDVTRRLTELHQGKNVDLHWLKAAIDNAIDLQGETA